MLCALIWNNHNGRLKDEKHQKRYGVLYEVSE